MPQLLSVFVDETVAIIALIAFFALIAIPVLGLIYAGVKMLFPFHANDKAVGLSGLGIWVGALVILLIFGASEAMRYNASDRVTAGRTIETDSLNQIYVLSSVKDVGNIDHMRLNFGYHKDIMVTQEDEDLVVLGRPELNIIRCYYKYIYDKNK